MPAPTEANQMTAPKLHTTNYTDTFIAVADDCPALQGEVPPEKSSKKSVARLQYELLRQHPYQFTSDDILFRVFAERNDLPDSAWETARRQFFSKGQPCFRASPLTKRYGWGVHSDEHGKIALYGRDSEAYTELASGKKGKVVMAMRTKR